MPNVSNGTKVTKRNLQERLKQGVQISRMGNHKTITKTALVELLGLYAEGKVKFRVDTQKRIFAYPKDHNPKRGRPRKDAEQDTEVIAEVDAVAAAA